jgi:hypothetical protein
MRNDGKRLQRLRSMFQQTPLQMKLEFFPMRGAGFDSLCWRSLSSAADNTP